MLATVFFKKKKSARRNKKKLSDKMVQKTIIGGLKNMMPLCIIQIITAYAAQLTIKQKVLFFAEQHAVNTHCDRKFMCGSVHSKRRPRLFPKIWTWCSPHNICTIWSNYLSRRMQTYKWCIAII